jgi:hypothetical protein
MKIILSALALAISTLVLLSPAAEAASHRGKAQTARGIDKRVKVAGIATGAAATVGYFAINDWKWHKWHYRNPNGITAGGAYMLTSIGCAAAAPIVATVFVNRPLTPREATTLTVGCFIPFVGPLVLNAIYNAHPEWDAPR